jgi:hypothetical protein
MARSTQLQGNPFTNAVAITPNDSTQLAGIVGLWVGGAGTVVVEMLNPESPAATVTFSAVPAGTILPISVRRVLAATGATLILGLRR